MPDQVPLSLHASHSSPLDRLAPDDKMAVAIVTYQRPHLLGLSLAAVLEQARVAPVQARVIVVDNDPQRSAWPVVDGLSAGDVQYVSQPSPGLAAVRNAALDAASEYRLLAFIDDDETPEDGWLAALLDAWSAWGCDGVVGPTYRRLGGAGDAWVRASNFFQPRTRPDGLLLPSAPAGNMLIDLETVRKLGVRFDEEFGLTGGEDTFFTRQLTSSGAVMRWCSKAITSEPVPVERATRGWILRREVRTGSTWSRSQVGLARSGQQRCRVIARMTIIAAKLATVGAGRVLLGRLTGRLPWRAQGEREVARSAGVLLGIVGGKVKEYGRA